jgi:hypothetical protein
MSDETFGPVTALERPLHATRCLADALALITDTIEEPAASAINEIVHTMLDHISELDELHETLFRLHHPDRARFEREGWPDKLEDNPDID